ncbi:MAG: type II/IV secretion system protein [Candidatus Omnitrophica bacterium]|nr:type II/IV secretion system protein [Candidatus Omnitrophota bacterium]
MNNHHSSMMSGPLARFPGFVEFICSKTGQNQLVLDQLKQMGSTDLFRFPELTGITEEILAEFIAEYCALPLLTYINPSQIHLEPFSKNFCRAHHLVPLKDEKGRRVLALANPFNLELLDSLAARFQGQPFEIRVAERQTIAFLLVEENVDDSEEVGQGASGFIDLLKSERELEKFPIIHMASNLLHAAALRKASDIHIEPKDAHIAVRFRIDGDMNEVYGIKKETGVKLISRFKVLGGLDISEKRKPQDGAVEVTIDHRIFKLRLATSSTPKGECLIIRLLDTSVKPRSLDVLGMSSAQVKSLIGLANRQAGLILIVGSTGSGKTTTIYSLLAQMNCATKSLISVEDPVEYRIPFANQQQVNEKAGLTFESLLKSTLRQDPDILFLGEVRDPFSAKSSFDFASTGHVTVTSLHTANATTAIFRLERLGITRENIADTILGIVAQKLLKKLCVHCKQTGPPTAAEKEWLVRFRGEMPSTVARPKAGGCVQCNHSGYSGREGVYEIIEFDAEITARIRAGQSISEIRGFIEGRGDYLMSHSAVDKVRQLIFSPKDIYEKVLVEEPEAGEAGAEREEDIVQEETAAKPARREVAEHPSILVVEDDRDMRLLLRRLLESRGYEIIIAEDGVEALLTLGKKKFDLILSDVNMPNLNGFKLLEMLSQKGIRIPVLFLTGQSREEDEITGFELGAFDYIKKPVQKEILLHRIRKALQTPS